MTKRGAAQAILLLALVLGFAGTVNAQASCSQSDVQTAVNNAARGATITVPAGSCTWSTTVNLTKGITLQGAGPGSTVITNGLGVGTVLQITPDSTAIANDEIIKVTGFTFDGAASGFALIDVKGAADTGTKPFRNLIITGNTFRNMGSTSGNGNTAIYVVGQARGVIYSNIFDRCDIIFRPMGNDSTTEWSNTAYNQFSYGSSDNLYFEDNTIEYTSAYSSLDLNPAWIESGQGGRAVVRFNTWNLTNLTGAQEFWDEHGFQNWTGVADSGQTGTMLVEYYDNTFSNVPNTVYRWIDARGTQGIFFDNTYSGASNPAIEVNQYAAGCLNLIIPTPINYNPVLNNTYFFNNLVNGTLKAATLGANQGCGIAENQNWWNQQSSFNGTVGVGRGTKASMPATCTTGVGFWVTDEGSWNTKLPPNTSGQFYKCTSTNTWTLYYTPYTYPDPLRNGSSTSIHPATNLTLVVH